MIVLRKAVYGIPALLVAMIIVAGSFALADPPVTHAADPVLQVQPQAELGPLAESITPVGLPIVFDQDDDNGPNITNEVAEGLRVQTKQRALVNFVANVGDEVEVELKVENLSEDAEELLALITAETSDNLLIDVEMDTDDDVRLLGENQWVVKLDRGIEDITLVIIPLEEGLHSFFVEIRHLG